MRSRISLALSAALLASVAMTGCSGGRAGKTADTATASSPYVAGNYPGTLKIGNPYEIQGRTYIPAHDPNYVEEGVASWYGPGFHGRSTANGERFDQNGLTAAHRTLPMPSMVRVTNLENGRSAIVKVNDRGPFAKDRIIDLSKRTAEVLGVIAKGTARVRVEYLPDETRQMIAELMRNNQIKADEATLTMLAMNDLQYGAPVTSDAYSPGFGSFISSANASESIHAAPQRGVVERAPLAPVESHELAAPAGSASVALTTPSGMALDVPPVGAIPNTSATAQAARTYASAQPPRTATARAATYYEPEPVSGTTALTTASSGIFIQAGSFSQEQNAHELSRRLASLGHTSVKPVDIGGRTWYRVRLGPLDNMGTAHAALQDMQGMGLNDARVVKD